MGVADSADHYWVGATYQATERLAVTAASFYIKVGDGGGDASHDPASHATLYALGTTYNLSARTFLYGTVAYVRNSSQGSFSVFATPRDSGSPTSPVGGRIADRRLYGNFAHVLDTRSAVRLHAVPGLCDSNEDSSALRQHCAFAYGLLSGLKGEPARTLANSARVMAVQVPRGLDPPNQACDVRGTGARIRCPSGMSP